MVVTAVMGTVEVMRLKWFLWLLVADGQARRDEYGMGEECKCRREWKEEASGVGWRGIMYRADGGVVFSEES